VTTEPAAVATPTEPGKPARTRKPRKPAEPKPARTRIKREYRVQVVGAGPPAPSWIDTEHTGANEADALKAAKSANLRGRVRIIRVCGVFELTEKNQPRVTVARMES